MMGRIIFLVVGTVLLTVVHYLLSCKIDFLIAKCMGDVQRINETGWTSYGNIGWTFSSLLGPAWALHIAAVLVVALLAGFSLSLFLVNLMFKISPVFGHHYWIAITIVITWILRIPLPLKYSLFYFTSVQY